MKKLFLIFILFQSFHAYAEQIVSLNFDWDDTAVYMPTTIVLFHKQTGKELEISTHEFAKHGESFGVSGPYKDYEARYDPKTGSYRHFRDLGRYNYFLADLRAALKDKTGVWKGPSFNELLFTLRHKETAQWLTILTTRGHSPATFLKALRILKRRGHIKYLPRRANIHPVLWELSEQIKGKNSDNTKQRKEYVVKVKIEHMFQMLDKLQSISVDDTFLPVASKNPNEAIRKHLWAYYDDDVLYFKVAVEKLSEGVKAGRWSNVKVVVYFTAPNHPEMKQQGVVLTSEGTRLLLPGEQDEAVKIVKYQKAKQCEKLLEGV